MPWFWLMAVMASVRILAVVWLLGSPKVFALNKCLLHCHTSSWELQRDSIFALSTLACSGIAFKKHEKQPQAPSLTYKAEHQTLQMAVVWDV